MQSANRRSKIAAVAMIRDECDIVELFIKHNLDVVDTIYIIDHFSTDGTKEIVSKLMDRGLSVKLRTARQRTYNQSTEVSAVTQELARSGDYGYIVPLDADEFLPYMARSDFHDLIADQISFDQCGYMLWQTFCPIEVRQSEVRNPLLCGFVARSHEASNFQKVIVGTRLAERCTIATGAHRVRGRFRRVRAVDLGMALQHVPVRSSDQIVRKALTGNFAFSATPGRRRGEGSHWTELAKEVRRQNYSLPFASVQDLALGYPQRNSAADLGKRPTVTAQTMQLSPDHTLDYPDLAQVDLLRGMDMFFESLLSDSILMRRRGAPWDRLHHQIDRLFS